MSYQRRQAHHGWRFMVAVGGILPIILAAWLPFCPESPRQLIAHGKFEESRKVIARVFPHATPKQVVAKADHILQTISAMTATEESLWWQFKQPHCIPSNFRALVAACTVMTSKSPSLLTTSVVTCLLQLVSYILSQSHNFVASIPSCTTLEHCFGLLVSISPLWCHL